MRLLNVVVWGSSYSVLENLVQLIWREELVFACAAKCQVLKAKFCRLFMKVLSVQKRWKLVLLYKSEWKITSLIIVIVTITIWINKCRPSSRYCVPHQVLDNLEEQNYILKIIYQIISFTTMQNLLTTFYVYCLLVRVFLLQFLWQVKRFSK